MACIAPVDKASVPADIGVPGWLPALKFWASPSGERAVGFETNGGTAGCDVETLGAEAEVTLGEAVEGAAMDDPEVEGVGVVNGKDWTVGSDPVA